MNDVVTRRYFAFALRDVLPIDENGWTVVSHNDDCPVPCTGVLGCRGSHVEFIQNPARDSGFADALVELSKVVEQITGENIASRLPVPKSPMGLVSFAIASTAVFSDESEEARLDTFDRSFELFQRSVDALRHSTWSRVPAQEIERLWPTFLVLEQRGSGPPAVVDFDTLDHGTFFATTRAATSSELLRAGSFVAASFNHDPVENFRYLHLAAYNARVVEGDYVGAVLKAATAAEILIKHTASMLIWEATKHRDTPPRWALLDQPLAQKPSKLISAVLSSALKGSWSSQLPKTPIGAWRYHIARVRSQVIHRGHRPSAQQVDASLKALSGLVKHQ